MKPFTFRGPCAPVFTAFTDDSEKSVDVDIIPEYAKFLSDNGVHGVLINGTTGEGMSLNVAQRKALAEKWVEARKTTKQHVMIQVGGAPLPDVLELAKHAEAIGADSLLCLPELYFKPTTVNDLIHYLGIVSNAAPNTPLLYYHIPAFTNVHIHMGKFLNEVDGKIPTFCGIKFTSEVLDEGLQAVSAHDKKFAVFLGADTLMERAYGLGFDSAIATTFNIFPFLGVKLYEKFREGKFEEAKELQEKLSAAIGGIVKHGTWVPTMKAAMNIYTPIYTGPVKEPLISLNKAQCDEIRSDLEQLNIQPKN